MAGGHKVDPAQLNEAAKILHDVPTQACEQPIAAVEQVQVTREGFGAAHVKQFDAFAAGMAKVAKSARSYLTASDEFGQKLAKSKNLYQSNEDATASGMGKH